MLNKLLLGYFAGNMFFCVAPRHDTGCPNQKTLKKHIDDRTENGKKPTVGGKKPIHDEDQLLFTSPPPKDNSTIHV